MKSIFSVLMFCLISVSAFASQFTLNIQKINNNCQQSWFRVYVVGGIGPFSFVFHDNLGGTTGILASAYDSVLVESNRNVPIDYYVVAVTDLSDNTIVQGGLPVFGDAYKLNPNPDTLTITNSTSCGSGCNGSISICNITKREPDWISSMQIFWSDGPRYSVAKSSCL